MIHYAHLLGKPWACPCDPPKTYDCYEIVRTVMKQQDHPIPAYIEPQERTADSRGMLANPPDEWLSNWRTGGTEPREGLVVGFGKTIMHCGVMITDRDVLHAFSPDGHTGSVQVTPMRMMELFYGPASFWEFADA